MADFTLKRGDRYPVIRATLKNPDGTVKDLTGHTVKINMALKANRNIKISASADIVAPATGGIVQYSWGASDTNVAGLYDLEFEATETSSSKTTTFPNDSFLVVEVKGDLA